MAFETATFLNGFDKCCACKTPLVRQRKHSRVVGKRMMTIFFVLDVKNDVTHCISGNMKNAAGYTASLVCSILAAQNQFAYPGRLRGFHANGVHGVG